MSREVILKEDEHCPFCKEDIKAGETAIVGLRMVFHKRHANYKEEMEYTAWTEHWHNIRLKNKKEAEILRTCTLWRGYEAKLRSGITLGLSESEYPEHFKAWLKDWAIPRYKSKKGKDGITRFSKI